MLHAAFILVPDVLFLGLLRYALLGAASFLGGSMRMTVSLCVIMVEITNNLKLLPLIMLVLLISKVLFLGFVILLIFALWNVLSLFPWQAVGDAFNEGLYEEQAQLRGIPLLESRPKYQMRKMAAKEACGQRVNVTYNFKFSINYWFWMRICLVSRQTWVFPTAALITVDVRMLTHVMCIGVKNYCILAQLSFLIGILA